MKLLTIIGGVLLISSTQTFSYDNNDLKKRYYSYNQYVKHSIYDETNDLILAPNVSSKYSNEEVNFDYSKKRFEEFLGDKLSSKINKSTSLRVNGTEVKIRSRSGEQDSSYNEIVFGEDFSGFRMKYRW